MLIYRDSRIAKALRLHDDPGIDDIERTQDPALPTHLPLYSRELIRRAFHHLVYLDLFDCNISTVNPGRPLQLFPPGVSPGPEPMLSLIGIVAAGSYSTPAPSNFHEDSLTSLLPPEHPETMHTKYDSFLV